MIAEDDRLDLDNQVCFSLAVAARSMVSVYRPILEPLGLTHPQHLVMLVIWQRGSSSVGAIAAALHLDSATVSPLVRRLEGLDLVTRARSREDERVVEVTVTEKGAKLRAQALDVPGRVIERLGLQLAELEVLRTALMGFILAAAPAEVEA